MVSWDDKEMKHLCWISMIGCCVSLGLSIVCLPYQEKQIKINEELENRIEVLENTYQK